MKNRKCSSKQHEEIDSIAYCEKCEIYMCNKCENLHSNLFANHHSFIIEKNNEEKFTGLCKEKNHNYELQFFCKTHNQLCCAICLCKIKKDEIGKHKDCDVCNIEDIKDEKKKKLEENIKCLEELSKNLEESIKKLKPIFEKINQQKEDLKLKIQKVFTNIRNELNNREDELLLEVDKKFEDNYFKEELIKESEKLPNKIKISLEKGKNIDKEYDKTKLNLLINDCINIENNIKDINSINESIKKCNDLIDINFFLNLEEEEINQFISNLKKLGNLENKDAFFKSSIINKDNKYNIITKWIKEKTNKNQ